MCCGWWVAALRPASSISCSSRPRRPITSDKRYAGRCDQKRCSSDVHCTMEPAHWAALCDGDDNFGDMDSTDRGEPNGHLSVDLDPSVDVYYDIEGPRSVR